MTEALVTLDDDGVEVKFNVDKAYADLVAELLEEHPLRPASKHVYQTA